MNRGKRPAGRPPWRSPAKPDQEGEEQPSSRQERREERRAGERQRMAKHGASLRRVYPDAVRKRTAAARKKRRKA
jgi:protein tyrosine phosphatase (PTP) superfamily phosphohydrolase (DUF442 family)